MAYTFHHLPRPNWRERWRIRRIYGATFPADLRHAFRYLREDIRSGERLLYVARDRAARGRIVSLAILACLDETDAVYGEYFATDPALQNQGLGRDLFAFLTAHLGEQMGRDALVFDAEAPRTDAPDDIDRRRLRYHERLGARYVPQMAHYRVPDGDTTEPMHLMWVPLGTRTAAPDNAEIAAWVRGIFQINGYDLALAEQLIREMDAGDPA